MVVSALKTFNAIEGAQSLKAVQESQRLGGEKTIALIFIGQNGVFNRERKRERESLAEVNSIY